MHQAPTAAVREHPRWSCPDDRNRRCRSGMLGTDGKPAQECRPGRICGNAGPHSWRRDLPGQSRSAGRNPHRSLQGRRFEASRGSTKGPHRAGVAEGLLGTRDTGRGGSREDTGICPVESDTVGRLTGPVGGRKGGPVGGPWRRTGAGGTARKGGRWAAPTGTRGRAAIVGRPDGPPRRPPASLCTLRPSSAALFTLTPRFTPAPHASRLTPPPHASRERYFPAPCSFARST